jgi:hypothetical protein
MCTNRNLFRRTVLKNKSAPANKKKVFYIIRDPNKQEVGSFL